MVKSSGKRIYTQADLDAEITKTWQLGMEEGKKIARGQMRDEVDKLHARLRVLEQSARSLKEAIEYAGRTIAVLSHANGDVHH